MNIPNYDAYKLATPPRYEDAPAERIECPSCGEIVEQLEAEGICRECWVRSLVVECHFENHPAGEPEEDEPADADATPIVEGDDPDEHVSDDPRHYRDLGGES